MSHKGYVSKPPIPEEREANCLRDEAVKRRKDAARDAATRKKERKERHEKECKIADAEGAPRPATPESTEEEDSSDVVLNFLESDDNEAVMGADSPPAYRGAGGEDMMVTLGKARLTPGSLVEPHPARIERFHTGGATRVAHAGSGQQIVQARDGAEVAPAGDG